MATTELDLLVRQLSDGFDALQEEYQKLVGHHQALERKLATAREQYNDLAKLYNVEQSTTPPLSLSSSPASNKEQIFTTKNVAEILGESADQKSQDAAKVVRVAILAAESLRKDTAAPPGPAAHGVKIWSGPAADRPEVTGSMMPSISESPLEQDFTVEGKPSQLGCPFASMKNKKLSSHAASVLSRYNQNDSATGSTHLTHVSRINGMESLSRRQSTRASLLDPIRADICGLSDHNAGAALPSEKAPSKAPTETIQIENAEVGVCPIRFLDQHSPEEVATYFEKHKHELPRSHEECVMRYQSNEEQIKQLDTKYGNLVSMIQGLGKKHKQMLPNEPADDENDEDEGRHSADDEKIRKWASSVSVQVPGVDENAEQAGQNLEERLPHFERPVREVRLGESPSRPWGIQVPAKFLERAESERSSKPAQVTTTPAHQDPNLEMEDVDRKPAGKPAGKCPFDHAAMKEAMGGHTSFHQAHPATKAELQQPASPDPVATAPSLHPSEAKSKAREISGNPQAPSLEQRVPIVINGPVFIGYGPEDAIRLLRESGIRM